MSTATQQVDAPAWLSDFYAKVDDLDIEAVAAYFSANATWRYGSGDTAVGRDAIRGGMMNFPRIRGIRHEFLKVWDTGSTLIVEANVTYTTQDGLPDGTVSAAWTPESTGRSAPRTAYRVAPCGSLPERLVPTNGRRICRTPYPGPGAATHFVS